MAHDFSGETNEALYATYGATKSEDSFTELHRRLSAKLRGFLMWRFNFDDYTSDEICQTAWINLAKVAARPCSNFWARLRQNARWAAGQFLRDARSGQRGKQKCVGLEFYSADGKSPDPADESAVAEDAQRCREALQRIEPEQRTILESFYVDEMNMRSAAGRLHPERAIKKSTEAFRREFAAIGNPSPMPVSDEALRELRLASMRIKDKHCAENCRSYKTEAKEFMASIDVQSAAAKLAISAEAFQAIDVRVRPVAYLRFVEGLSPKQIAERLGIAVSTTCRRIKAAKVSMQTATTIAA